MAGPVVLRLSDGQMQIRDLVHHVEQGLARLLVVERRMDVVRSKPALRPEGIEAKCPQGRVLLDLGDVGQFRWRAVGHRLPAVLCELIDGILERGELSGYALAHSARGELLSRCGDNANAIKAIERALSLTMQSSERRFLNSKLVLLRST